MAENPPPRLKFGRAMRLKQGRDFARLKQQGRRQVCGLFVANWLVVPAGSPSRLGVITTKKLGNAVVRARARRLLRETFRLHQHELAMPVDLVLVAQHRIKDQTLPAISEAFELLLRKSGLQKTEVN